jgi:hypothetical protein
MIAYAGNNSTHCQDDNNSLYMNQQNIANNQNINNNTDDTPTLLDEHIYNYPSNTNLPSPQHINESTDLSNLRPNCGDKATSPHHTLYYNKQDLQVNTGYRHNH